MIETHPNPGLHLRGGCAAAPAAAAPAVPTSAAELTAAEPSAAELDGRSGCGTSDSCCTSRTGTPPPAAVHSV